MDLIEEIKKRINIVELANEFGLQPTKKDFIFSIYKKEKNRSLKLYPETNSFYCFATGRGGDVINFYADYKRIGNREAIVILAKELGIENGNHKSKHTDAIDKNNNEEYTIKQERCTCLPDRQAEIYQKLESYCNGVDKKTLQYLKGPKRGLTENSIKRFRLFSIKDLDNTIDYLINSFHLNELKASGLFNEKGRFVFAKHWLIIPYLNCDQIVYLRGRVMPEYENNDIGKYIR